MDFELSDDQRALADAAADLLDSLAGSEQVRAAAVADDRVDRALWKSMAEQGWMAVELSEDRGGLGLGSVEAAVLCEQVGRHVAPAPFLPSLLALGALASADENAWVERLASGEAMGCVTWAPTGVVAEQDGGGWVLSGRPAPVVHAPVADVAVIATEDAVFA